VATVLATVCWNCASEICWFRRATRSCCRDESRRKFRRRGWLRLAVRPELYPGLKVEKTLSVPERRFTKSTRSVPPVPKSLATPKS
jgi:hypothetical protein